MKKILLLLMVFSNCFVLFSQDLTKLTEKKQVKFDGTVSTTANFYNMSGKESTRDPFSYVLSGNMNLTVYGLSLPFSFTYSNNNFDYAQPFNRFGISPEYKWVKLHLGYRSLSFSPFTLAGHSFMGAGVELNPGKFRLSGVYGRFNQKTVPNTVNPMDTLMTPTRKGYSFKIGVGSAQNFVDFIYLQIKDDTLSIDTTGRFGSKTPQANSVIGTHLKFMMAKNLTFETEGAFSLFTKDLYDKRLSGIDNAFIQNLSKSFNVNTTSEYSTALQSSLNYSNKTLSLGLQYRRIAPNFQSFGAYYFNTDLENITLNTKFRLFKNKISVNGNVGLQKDNLKNNKASSSSRVISMVNVAYNSGKVFSLNGSYSNYSINQQAGRLPLNDTIKLYQSNRNITITPMLSFANAKAQQNVQINFTLMDLLDHNPYTSATSQVNSQMAMLNYFYNHIKSGLSVMTGISYNSLSSVYSTQKMTGGNASLGKSFLKNKLASNISFSANRSELNSEIGWVNTGTLSLSYRPHPKHSFKLNFSQMQNKYPNSSTIKSFNETKTLFSYVYKI